LIIAASGPPFSHRAAVCAARVTGQRATGRYAWAGLQVEVFEARRNEWLRDRCSSGGYNQSHPSGGEFRLRPCHAVSRAQSNKLIVTRGQYRSEPRKDSTCPQEI